MANLGSEVSRLISSKEKNDMVQARESLARALQIIEKICELPDMKKRLGEIFLLKQVITDMAQPKQTTRTSSEQLTSYFRPFALRLLRQ